MKKSLFFIAAVAAAAISQAAPDAPQSFQPPESANYVFLRAANGEKITIRKSSFSGNLENENGSEIWMVCRPKNKVFDAGNCAGPRTIEALNQYMQQDAAPALLILSTPGGNLPGMSVELAR